MPVKQSVISPKPTRKQTSSQPKLIQTEQAEQAFAEADALEVDMPLRRKLANPRDLNAAEVIKLQHTVGNQAVLRLLSKGPAVPPVQRVLTLPNTDTKLDIETPGPKRLNMVATELETAVRTGLATDIDAPTSPVAQAIAAFNPQTLAGSSLNPLWGYTGADAIIPGSMIGAPRLAAMVTNRKQTLQHHLGKTLWQELADSTTRRVQKETSDEIVALRQRLAVEAAQAEKNKLNNKAKDTVTAVDEYKKLKLDTYINQIKKQEQLAASITNQVAYKVAKRYINPDTYPLITQIADNEKQKRVTELAKPVVESLQKQYDKKVSEPIKSLRRKHARLLALRKEIKGNPTMWDMTARKYKTRLLEEFEKLNKANYQQSLIANIDNITAELEATAKTEATSAIEAAKKATAEEIRTKFKAGSKNLKHADNTDERHRLKNRLTSSTKRVLSNDAPQIATRDAAGQVRVENSSAIVDKAKTKTITEAMEGAVHSRLGKIAKVVEPLFPKDGDKGKVEFLLKVPVGDPGGGGYVGMRFTGQIEHEIEWAEKSKKDKDTDKFMPLDLDGDGNKKLKADTFKIKADLAINGGYRVPFVLDVGGEIGGYLEVESDKGLSRAMELISFGFYRRFRESKVVPHLITDQMWGLGGDSVGATGNKSQAKTKEAKAWGKAFQEGLSDKEFIETGGFGAANASASISGLANAKAGLRGFTGKRYTKQTMSALEKNKAGKQQDLVDDGSTRERNLGRHMNGAELSFEFGVGPFAIGGKVKGTWLDNQAGTNLDEDLTKKIDRLEEAMNGPVPTDLDPVKDNELKAAWSKIPAQLVALKKERRLLKLQMFSVETEANAASKGGSFANPTMIAAQSLNWAAQVGTKVRSAVVSFQDQYGKDKKGKNFGSSLFAAAFTGIDAGVNHTNSFDAATAATKLKSNSDLINTQMGKSLHGAASNQTAIDKMSQFAVKNGGGLKLTFKHSTKRDFASSDEGAKFSKNYPTKVEFIMDAVSGLTLGSQIAAATLEKSTRLFRLGVKYKDGNMSLMTM